MEPKIIRNKEEMRNWSRSMRAQGKTIGLVPTMGYLHQGHLSLITEAQKHTHLTVVSIYVNPGQFALNEDLSTYPSDFNGDILKLMSIPNPVDVVFNPKNLYETEQLGVSCLEGGGGKHETWVRVEKLEQGMCGKSRPVFFRGVATVVAKLFNIVEPDVVVFGKKDYQQWRVIQRMGYGPNGPNQPISNSPNNLLGQCIPPRDPLLVITSSADRPRDGASGHSITVRRRNSIVRQQGQLINRL